jgi:hypothetical protein
MGSCGAANHTGRCEDTALHAIVKFTETKEEGEDEAAATTKKSEDETCIRLVTTSWPLLLGHYFPDARRFSRVRSILVC